MLALGQRQIKQVEPLRRLVDDRLQRALKRLETDDLELAHLRDRIRALGVVDPACRIEAPRSGWTGTFWGLSSIDSILSALSAQG